MQNLVFLDSLVFLTGVIEKAPGPIMGPINSFIGYILNIIFNIIYYLTEPNSLGIAIIIFTIIMRCLMIPSGIKTQRSSIIMKKLQPEIEKIKAKYGSSKDPEIQRKITAETQALYAKHNYNPFGGCLPLLVTMPLFFALYYCFRQPYMFIETVGNVYKDLAMRLMQADNFSDVVLPIAVSKVPNPPNMDLNFSLVSDLIKALNKFTTSDWEIIMNSLQGSVVPEVQAVLDQKVNFETFLGLNLLNTAGWSFPGVIIPVLSAGTQFVYAFFNYKMNPSQDPNGKSTQMIMMVVMPVFMGYITAGMSIGVGLYWITGNVFMFVQQIVISKYLSLTANKKEEQNG